jgi:HTH-type transcriptional regulator / antitoxin HigA
MRDVGGSEMTIATLEKKLKPLEAPVDNELLRWLYLHLPAQPIKNRKMHRSYSEAIRILMRESGSLETDNRQAVGQYLSAVIPFIEQYEKREFPIGPATPEEVLRFLMEQHDLSQYDLAKELGGQPVVSQIIRGKRRLTREHIERLSKRFRVTPATFYPGATSA